jgi:Putative metallopeptidase
MKLPPALFGVSVAAGLVVAPAAGIAQRAPELQSSKVEILYEEPKNSKFSEIRDRMVQRGVLEDLRLFLAPLRLPKKLSIATRQCEETNAFYKRGEGVTICYEYIAKMEEVAPAERTAEGVSRASSITGSVVRVLMHELGHATFDILDAPIYGREEDAADQMSAFIMVQFGKDVARWLITGGIHSYRVSMEQRQWSRTDFSDEHGSDAQRFYNFLCIGYGAEPAAFQDFVDKNLLPRGRAANCGREYQQVRRAFLTTVMPYVDQNLMKIVQGTNWLRPVDIQ